MSNVWIPLKLCAILETLKVDTFEHPTWSLSHSQKGDILVTLKFSESPSKIPAPHPKAPAPKTHPVSPAVENATTWKRNALSAEHTIARKHKSPSRFKRNKLRYLAFKKRRAETFLAAANLVSSDTVLNIPTVETTQEPPRPPQLPAEDLHGPPVESPVENPPDDPGHQDLCTPAGSNPGKQQCKYKLFCTFDLSEFQKAQ